jgi:hypothetical protein
MIPTPKPPVVDDRPPGTEVTTSLKELVTPAIAAEWLHEDINKCNRPLKDLRVEADARDMKEGRWDEDLGDPIRFDWHGKMRDGQHRLKSLVLAGVSLRFTVIRGLDPKSIKNVDVGAPRRFTDVLVMDGIAGDAKPRDLSAITRRAFLWSKGFRVGSGGKLPHPTHGELADFLEANPELRYAAIRGRDINLSKKEKLLPSAVAGFAYWACASVDYEQAENFFGKFMSGANLSDNSPVLVLRQRLASATHLKSRLRPAEYLALTFRAWNHYRADESAERLQITRGGLTDTNFPVPK